MSTMYLTKVIVLLLVGVQFSQSARILGVVNVPSYSHQMFFQPIWRELLKRGHELVLITTDPMEDAPGDIRYIDISDSYVIWREHSERIIKNYSVLTIVQDMFEVFYKLVEGQLSHPDFQAMVHNKSEHFDLLMIESLGPTMYKLKERFDCPLIGITSLDTTNLFHEVVGNPTHSSLYPVKFFEMRSDGLLDRTISLLITAFFASIERYSIVSRQNELTVNYFPKTEKETDFYELMEKVDLMLINTNPIFNTIRPLTPATIPIGGGMHIREEKPLPKELQLYLDSATEGFIYFSLGTNVKSKDLTNEQRELLMNAFKALPYKVLWKFEDESLKNKPDNIKIMKWLPQQDVLRHKNIKLFISQAGLQSIEEALFLHVPVLLLPFFADQESNAQKAVDNGLGLMLDYKTMTENEFRDTIKEIITNPKYKQRVKELADLLNDQPMKPLDKAIWWIEYTIRNKGALNLKGPRLPFYQYYYLDIFAIIGLVLFITTWIIKKTCCLVKKCFKSQSKLKKQ